MYLTRCNTLQHTATHCNTLQHTSPAWRCRAVLQSVAVSWGKKICILRAATHGNTHLPRGDVRLCSSNILLTPNLLTPRISFTLLEDYTSTVRNELCNTLQHTATHCNTHFPRGDVGLCSSNILLTPRRLHKYSENYGGVEI